MTGHARRHNQQQRAYQSRSHQRASSHPSNLSSHNPNHSYHQSRQDSFSCSLSICYSYLLAIFSSFLVVLGVYLSITSFNARFLYLSLGGLLIEALGACLYCISNIHKSKLAQHKQASDEFNIENNEMPSGTAAIQLSEERPALSRQQQAQAVTHILTNRTLKQSAISPQTSSTTNQNNSNDPANPINSQHVDVGNHPNTVSAAVQDDSQPYNSADNQSIGTSSSTGALLHKDTLAQHRDEDAIAVDEQPCTSNHITCQELPPQESSTTPATSQAYEPNNQELPRTHDIIQNDKYVAVPQESEDAAQDNQSKTQASTSSDGQASAIDETDLISSQTMAHLNESPIRQQIGDGAMDGPPTQPAERASLLPTTPQAKPSPPASARNRSSNLRRTLVMGLSGEEEMIEIDEEDLDNMSILPPPYESIAIDNDGNKHHQSQ